MKSSLLIVATALMFGVAACSNSRNQQPSSPSGGVSNAVSGPFTDQELQAFAALNPIDTHAHVFHSDPAFNAMLQKLNLRILDIVLVDDNNPELKDLSAESKAAWQFVHGSGGHAILCTSIDPYKMHERGFAQASIRGIDREFSQGAIAVKIWKNIGMEIKDAAGNYILPDDPAFAPIYKDISAHGKTLVAHVADPNSMFDPPNPDAPDYGYIQEHPFWYQYGKPHPASKEKILQARDHLLELNPGLRVVGAHLGSMESDFHQLAQHLERYPNFAVDLAARMPYLMMQPRADMIAFILKYQDRLIYATDNEFTAKDSAQPSINDWEETYAHDWRFFATNDTLDYKGRPVQGLALPEPVLRKLYHDNAAHWFPGIAPPTH